MLTLRHDARTEDKVQNYEEICALQAANLQAKLTERCVSLSRARGGACLHALRVEGPSARGAAARLAPCALRHACGSTRHVVAAAPPHHPHPHPHPSAHAYTGGSRRSRSARGRTPARGRRCSRAQMAGAGSAPAPRTRRRRWATGFDTNIRFFLLIPLYPSGAAWMCGRVGAVGCGVAVRQRCVRGGGGGRGVDVWVWARGCGAWAWDVWAKICGLLRPAEGRAAAAPLRRGRGRAHPPNAL